MLSDKLKEHLEIYKLDSLGIKEKGVYIHKSKRLLMGHILPKDKNRLNIINNYQKQFYESEYADIKFHKYFHHLNSSQALCINLFFPLIAESRLAVVTELLGLGEESVTKACFEKESDLENVRNNERKTSFDFYIELKSGHSIFFEIKYTENEFGSAKNDEEHQKKYNRLYEPLLRTSSYIQDPYKNSDDFLKHYQIMRNLIHLGEKRWVIFLYPRENKKVDTQANYAMKNILTEKGRKKFRILYLDDIYSCIRNHISKERLNQHYDEFEKKYLLLS